MRLVWYDALLNWLPACLIPDGFDKLVVIGNGKVQTELAFSALCISTCLPVPAHSIASLRSHSLDLLYLK